ncbi:MAG: peptidyl-prolyl cis-trans isomerase [Bacteroidetes bacterium]|nr:peptidyl-prolyl cis-trans isomerase [Bacteroidota bacterium]
MKKLNLIFLFSIIFFAAIGQNQFSEASKATAKKQIEVYRDRVVKGEKMEDIARQYSEDPGSSAKGGLYDNVGIGVMDPAFEKIAFSLKQGQVSQVFETPYGYHFIQLVRVHGKLRDLRHVLIIPK